MHKVSRKKNSGASAQDVFPEAQAIGTCIIVFILLVDIAHRALLYAHRRLLIDISLTDFDLRNEKDKTDQEFHNPLERNT